jgi:tryptophan-rich sensory protein
MKSSSTRGSYGVLGLLILLTFGIGWLGSRATLPEIPTWYAHLNKPTFNPPNYLFGPVWSSIYLLMTISMWMVWESNQSKSIKLFFILMLICNALWSPVFFKRHQIGWALMVLSFYIIMLGAWVRSLYLENKVSAYLQIPHLLWVSFASVLNASIYLLNR